VQTKRLLLTTRVRLHRLAFGLATLIAGGASTALSDGLLNAEPPVPAWTWGGDLRLRDEYFTNAFTLDSTAPLHEQSYQRLRERFWSTVAFDDDVALNVRLTCENWEWDKDAFSPPFQRGWVTSEGVIDLLNCKWKNAFGLPLRLIMGRQEIEMGDGWLIFDPSPLDGSRTQYFNAARGTLQLSAHTTLDLIFVDLPAFDGLPVLNNQHTALAEQSERGRIVYLSSGTSSSSQADAYFIQRDMHRVLANGDDGQFSAAGARVVGMVSPDWQVKAEAVYEFGTKDDRELRAWGSIGQATWFARDAGNNQFYLVAEALSGDRPGTSQDEQFDALWGRYPRWGEVPALVYALETRIGQFGNMLRIGPGWSFSPAKAYNITLNYDAIWALEYNRGTTGGLFSAVGRFRGHAVQSFFRYRLSNRWRALLQGESFLPGDYYATGKRATVTFLREELAWTF